ncbi:AAA family ATPase, partial [Lactobacillus nasalidis]
MRLKQIQIYNFGHFSQKTFDLPAGNLAAFFGGNEAGKSTTVAFIKQVLFGFNLKNTASAFFEDYEPLTKSYPMGGKLVFEAPEGEYELERSWSKGDKSKTGSLKVSLDGREVPASVFYDQIQNIDGGFYAESFIFNEDLLRQVSSLSETEILENIYYLGAAQSSQLLAIRADFDKEARDLFKPSGKKAPVNQDLLKLAAQRDKVAADGEEFDAYRQLELRRL